MIISAYQFENNASFFLMADLNVEEDIATTFDILSANLVPYR